MRYVDTSGLVAPPSWLARATRALARVEEAIDAHQVPRFAALWTDRRVRGPLIAIVGQKCWYCETNVHSSNPDVDHFRPKAGRTALDGHVGYWWLAYDPTNYRIACKYCNSGGGELEDGSRSAAKIARFPLLIESDRATGPCDDYHRERPVLLDPAMKPDHLMIDFSAEGRPRRRSTAVMSSLEKESGLCRVSLSIQICQLDRELLLEGRKGVMEDVADLSELASATSNEPAGQGTVERMLRKKIDLLAEYSAAALSALRAQRSNTIIEKMFAAEFAADLPEAAPLEVAQPTTINLAYLILTGMIEPGAELVGQGVFGAVRATVLADGRVRYGARIFANPDAAATIVTGDANIDGWVFWYIDRAGRQVTLSQLRDIAASQ